MCAPCVVPSAPAAALHRALYIRTWNLRPCAAAALRLQVARRRRASQARALCTTRCFWTTRLRACSVRHGAWCPSRLGTRCVTGGGLCMPRVCLQASAEAVILLALDGAVHPPSPRVRAGAGQPCAQACGRRDDAVHCKLWQPAHDHVAPDVGGAGGDAGLRLSPPARPPARSGLLPER